MRFSQHNTILSAIFAVIAFPVSAGDIAGNANDVITLAQADAAANRASRGAEAATRAGANAGSRTGVTNAPGRAGAASEALNRAGPNQRALDAAGRTPAQSNAGAALESAGPADQALEAGGEGAVSSGANTNASLTGRIQSSLSSDQELRSQDIRTDVSSDGMVTLSSTVENEAQKIRAEDLINEIQGVSSLESNLVVNAD